MIDFTLSDEQELLLDAIKECLQRNLSDEEIAVHNQEGTFPIKAWKAMAEAGFVGLGIPEEYGGTPCDILTLALANYTMSMYGGCVSALFSLGIPTMFDILAFGTEEQKQQYIQPYCAGGYPLAMAISEPGMGSDVSSMATSYVWEGDTAVINGGKHFISGAAEAPALILMAKDPSVPDMHVGSTMFLVDVNTPGIRINKLPKMGHLNNTTSICEVFISDVRIPRSCVLGVEHNGFKQTMANFEMERIASVSGMIASAEVAFEDACRYANQRIQYGRPIGTNQLVQLKVMEMAIKLENMMNMLYKMCWKVSTGQSIRIEQGMAKYYCSKAACEVIDDALQVLGGIGIVGDHRVSRLYIDSRGSRVGGGTDEVMVFNTAPQILKKFR